MTTPGRGTSQGKFVVDRVSGRIISAGPEEVDATQPLLEILINEAGWNPAQLITRPSQWRVPSSPSGKRTWPVDVAVFDDSSHLRDPARVIAFCECKRPDQESGIEQLKIYLDREPHARLGVWFNGIDHAVVYKTAGGYDVAPVGTPIPTPLDPLVPVGAGVKLLPGLRAAPSLVPAFKRIRDRLATLDANVNRDDEILSDISLLLLLKILDEQSNRFTPNRPLTFQIDVTPEKTGGRIRAFLDQEVKKNAQLFGANAREIRLQIDDSSIFYIVQTLQNYRLLSNGTDAVSAAFQVIRGKAYKGEEGQYFTPYSVVSVAVAAIDPRPDDRVIDPACGSGSFLAAALNHVVERLESEHGSDDSSVKLAKREWSTQHLFAIDKDSVGVRLSKAYLSMLGDGSTHVFKADSLRPTQWSGALHSIIQDGTFEVVVTNPPFGTKLKEPPEVGREENYELSRAWVRSKDDWRPLAVHEKRDVGLLFLERSMRLLDDGGRLAIVLPDTYLFSDKYGWLVQWLNQFTITHSINVPIEAFEPHCRAKTSVLVIKKEPPPDGHQVIGSVCETFGEDQHGRPRFKFVGDSQTNQRDDEMAEAAAILKGAAPTSDTKLRLRFSQAEAIERGVLVASYWWRHPYLQALQEFADSNDCELVSVGDLIDAGELVVSEGHGSPSSHFLGRGMVPYVKVADIKNWRVIENPKYALPQDVARRLRGRKELRPFDLVTPTRARKNIGLFGVLMPWQTGVVLAREIGVWRVPDDAKRIDRWLLLALMSLKVVHDQFRFLVLIQMNREDLGRRYREVLLPAPRDGKLRDRWSHPIQEYFEATAVARVSYDTISAQLAPELFADRP
jgi:type I restriction enzyme M protein